MDMEPAAAAPAGPDGCTVLAGQLAVGSTREPAASSPMVPFIQFTAYKATRLSDIVCKRAVRLYGDRVQTVHPQNGDLQGNEKTWYLDRTCRLEPEYVEEIVAEKRTVRPPGQWTVTAKLTSVTGQAQELIDLVGGMLVPAAARQNGQHRKRIYLRRRFRVSSPRTLAHAMQGTLLQVLLWSLQQPTDSRNRHLSSKEPCVLQIIFLSLKTSQSGMLVSAVLCDHPLADQLAGDQGVHVLHPWFRDCRGSSAVACTGAAAALSAACQGQQLQG
jgi:hypothetical protein